MSPAPHIFTALAYSENRDPTAPRVASRRKALEWQVTSRAEMGRAMKDLHVTLHRRSKLRYRMHLNCAAPVGGRCTAARGFKASVLALEARGASQERRLEGAAFP